MSMLVPQTDMSVYLSTFKAKFYFDITRFPAQPEKDLLTIV